MESILLVVHLSLLTSLYLPFPSHHRMICRTSNTEDSRGNASWYSGRQMLLHELLPEVHIYRLTKSASFCFLPHYLPLKS